MNDTRFMHDGNGLQAVLQLAKGCDYEVAHTHQVTRLALQMFDQLGSLHGLNEKSRFWLQCGALLHDIGWMQGRKGHHKASLQIILDTDILLFNQQERLIVGSIARYHRKALPKEKHQHFAALSASDQRRVSALSAILRVADGLDNTHRSVVQDLVCHTPPDLVIVECHVDQTAEAERAAALKKGNLLERAFGRRLVIDLQFVVV